MIVRRTIAAASITLMTAGLGFATAAPASAANNSQQSGLVNVSTGDIDVDVSRVLSDNKVCANVGVNVITDRTTLTCTAR